MDNSDVEKVQEQKPEVSLPGAAGGTEPTIIEVFNNNLINTNNSDSLSVSASELITPQASSIQSSEDIENDRISRTNIVENITNKLQSIDTSSASVEDVTIETSDTNGAVQYQQQQQQNHKSIEENLAINSEVLTKVTNFEFDIDNSDLNRTVLKNSSKEKDNNTKIFDIESHLIETFENYSVNESDNSGVSVQELPPAKEELSKPSTIESDNSIKTVIEIEPHIPVLHKTIETKVNINAQEPKIETELTNTSEESTEIKINNENSNNTEISTDHKFNNLTEKDFSAQFETLKKVPESPHIEAVFTANTNICSKDLQKGEGKENIESNQVNNPHIEEKDFKEKSQQQNNKSIIEQEKTSLKSDFDLNLTLKSPGLLRLIEKSLPKSLPDNKDILETVETAQDNQKFTQEQKPDPSEKCNLEEEVKLSEQILSVQDTNIFAQSNKTEEEISNDKKKEDKIELLSQKLGINGISTVASPEEEEAKKSFLESIPQLEEFSSNSATAHKQYQSLREYLSKKETSPPPVPIQTYRWEDLRRAKEKGGYPWTHLYKRPLGPDEEPEIVLLLRKSQELRVSSESPRSLKKVRIHDQVLVKETERYISDLSDTENLTETEDTRSAQSETTSLSESEEKPSKLSKVKGILKQNRPPKLKISTTGEEANGNKSEDSPKKAKCCHPIMDKLKIMADKQLKKRQIKKIPLKKDEKIILAEEQKILKLKLSPKAERSEIPHFIEKRDSDEILEDDKLEIVELDESPSKTRKRREQLALKDDSQTSVLVPDEIIEIPQPMQVDESHKLESAPQPIMESTCLKTLNEEVKTAKPLPPKKSPRKKKEHVYEDIDDDTLGAKIDEILEQAVIGALKQSLASQDKNAIKDLQTKTQLEEMGSSEETEEKQVTHLAPISSIDSTSSDEERKTHLPALAEESDQGEQQDNMTAQKETFEALKIVEEHELSPSNTTEIRSVLKREPSPSTSDKKVTFSHVEDESEPHREDIELPEHIKPGPNRWSNLSDHEYEPIGQPPEEKSQSTEPQREEESSTSAKLLPTVQISEPMEIEREALTTTVTVVQQAVEFTKPEITESEIAAEELQRNIEECYFSSTTTTPQTESRTESRTDYIHTSQVDSSAIEELPLKVENRKKGFMATAQDRSKKVQANLRSQAVKIRSKIRGIKKPPTSGSPKKERKRFKAPEFSKMKMPEMKFKAPDMSRFKAPDFKKIEFKRPEFTKFNKPDMSKFKMPEKFSSLKLKRSRSFKESEITGETTSITTPDSSTTPPKKKFEFNFGTYPRAFRQRRDKSLSETVEKQNDVITSSETPPSFESTTIPRGARDKGPVGSKWADKFSDVSYGDSESGKYQRYESSEPESIEPRESSLERKIRQNLDRVAKEDAEFGILQTVEQKQFAEYDEENRAIHEISKIRENEFKQRRPMVHQDSDLVSDEGKEIGWSEKDILRNKLLKNAETIDQDNFPSEEGLTGSVTNTNLETQSTNSSNAPRKGVIEEIDDDEFFLRKRGISQDNIEIRQYISTAIREGFDTPINALAKLGNSQEYYPDEMIISDERIDYGYDVPPPKPRRIKRFNNFDRNTGSAEVSQEFDVEQKENYDDNISLPQTGSDYFKQLPPARQLRSKSKKQYSEGSQEMPGGEDIPYFDEDEMFFKQTEEINNLGHLQTPYDHNAIDDMVDQIKTEPPKAPKRRKKQSRQSAEKELYLNGFVEESVPNNFQSSENQVEDLVVYRTEHIIPLAQPEQFTPIPTPPRRSRSRSRITDDDRTSHGADSLVFNEEESNFKIDMKENDGYAVVKKEPPPRPPAPVRRKRSTNSFDNRFATMPHIRKDSPIPRRPKRNYSTIGPARPPRRRSSASMGDTKRDFSSSYVGQYEELDIDMTDFARVESPKNLQSGDVISKMKDRPLPPPPRPPRENKKYKHITDEDNKEEEEAEKIIVDFEQNEDYQIDKPVEKCIEVEASTQTDPLPDDFVCEEFEITEDMKIIEPRRPKTLEDILKEEQEAEFERAKQLADEESLSRGIQRFRESSQRTFSERSKGSTADRSRTSLSRPATPSAILIERRVPTPIPYLDQTMLEASLIVQPVDDDEIIEKIESEPIAFEKKTEKSEEQAEEAFEDRLEDQAIISDTGNQFQEEEERLKEDLMHKLDFNKKNTEEYKTDERDFVLESNLDREIDSQNQNILKQDMKLEDTLQHETQLESDLPPQPPPRRRSSTTLALEQIDIIAEIPKTPSNQLLPISEFSTTPVKTVASNRLAITDLEVERLSVHALQAAQITVSQLQGSLISADDLDCKSGNLVVRNLELPPGLIEEIVERVRSSERPLSQAQTQTNETENRESVTTPTLPEEPPARPPPPSHQIFPSEYMQYSTPPLSFYQLRPPTDDDTIQPVQTHRRRRHHRRRDSSSDEESYRERRRSRQGTRSPEPTIGELGAQLLNACGTSVVRTMNQILNYLRAAEKEGSQRSNISTAIVILILATLGFLLLGISGKNIHHHHWDFFNLPGSDGRGNRGN